MRTSDLYFARNRYRDHRFLKMTKTRTVTFFMVIIFTCALILSMTDAYPTTETTPTSNATATLANQLNDTYLVITHVVRTIEIEMGILEDDGNDSDNITEISTPEYIETDVKFLNVNRLGELLNNATEPEATSTSNRTEGIPTELVDKEGRGPVKRRK